MTDWHRAPDWPRKSGFYLVVCNDFIEYEPDVRIYYFDKDSKTWRDERGRLTMDFHIPLGWADKPEVPAWAWLK